MLPQTHFLVSIVLFIIFYPFFGPATLWILAGGVLIDIDHPSLYIFRFKKFRLKEMFNYFENNKKLMVGLFVFHNVEFLLLMIALSFFYQAAFWFTIGLFVHYLSDWLSEFRKGGTFLKPYSFFYWLKIRKAYKQEAEKNEHA